MAGQLTTTIPELIETVRAARRRVRAGRARLAGALGPELVALLEGSHRARGEGRSDATGVTWTPLTAKYLKLKRRKGWSLSIGVRTGALLRSLAWSEQPRGLVAKYTAPSARFFEKQLEHGPRRRLMPTKAQFPREWTERLEALTQEWGDAELADALAAS